MINFADVVVGLAWGDESKGKISAQLASKKNDDGSSYYSCVARHPLQDFFCLCNIHFFSLQ